ncbi:MAG: T9SS type A sorting domain-containing protein, partial [Calditrichaeota bacterium]|nr:T9SS type A sorting domain-containing protein [Calditrichota bacterium]
VTGIVENRAPGLTPADFALHANYPNPFNPETTIEFDVARAGKVKLAVYNVLGQQIRILSNSQLNPGSYRVKWDGTNDSGEAVSSGIYFLRMSAGSFTQHRRMLLMK